jgi:hypothetical protein
MLALPDGAALAPVLMPVAEDPALFALELAPPEGAPDCTGRSEVAPVGWVFPEETPVAPVGSLASDDTPVAPVGLPAADDMPVAPVGLPASDETPVAPVGLPWPDEGPPDGPPAPPFSVR